MVKITVIQSWENSVCLWLNGSGLTRQIAMFPEDAAIDDFIWRLSVAEIEKDCSYSLFKHTLRDQILLNGEGLELKLPDETLTLDALYQAISFCGDIVASCHLLRGSVKVLNVMTCCGSVKAENNILRGPFSKQLKNSQYVYFIVNGEYEFLMPDRANITLREGDALYISADTYVFESTANNDATLIEVVFH